MADVKVELREDLTPAGGGDFKSYKYIWIPRYGIVVTVSKQPVATLVTSAEPFLKHTILLEESTFSSIKVGRLYVRLVKAQRENFEQQLVNLFSYPLEKRSRR